MFFKRLLFNVLPRPARIPHVIEVFYWKGYIRYLDSYAVLKLEVIVWHKAKLEALDIISTSELDYGKSKVSEHPDHYPQYREDSIDAKERLPKS